MATNNDKKGCGQMDCYWAGNDFGGLLFGPLDLTEEQCSLQSQRHITEIEKPKKVRLN